MRLKFTKMHGLGNDFIVLDLRKKDVKNLPKLMKKLAKLHTFGECVSSF